MKPDDQTAVAYIGLGSNLQDRADHLRTACQDLITHPDISSLDCSRFYQTAPMGPADQPDYLNAACCVETRLSPLALLDGLQAIEAAHGRIRTGERWTARPLDLDLLLYDDQLIDSERLQVPHPGIALRSFVLQPLRELNPDLLIPGIGSVGVLLDALLKHSDCLEIQLFSG